jgi:hypothetical protein
MAEIKKVEFQIIVKVQVLLLKDIQKTEMVFLKTAVPNLFVPSNREIKIGVPREVFN